MLNELFSALSNSSIEFGFRLFLFLIAASILTVLAFKLTVSVASNARVKARKEWVVQPAVDEEQSLVTRLVLGKVDNQQQEILLNSDVRRMLDEASKNVPKVDCKDELTGMARLG